MASEPQAVIAAFATSPKPHRFAQAGQLVALPEHRADRPQLDVLQWHLDQVFKAS